MKLASFDIFDTTLIRKCGKPENIFYILGHKLYPSNKAKREDFLLWRKKAESEARRQAPGKDVTIDDIYSSDRQKGFDEYSKKELIEAEKSVEAEQLMANPAIRDIINKKREEGYTICFISDMYLPSTTLKEVLAREGCIKDDENVYVSCEWNARKSNGSLYKRLKEKLQPEKWEHYGDHPTSDIKVARSNGIKATRVDTSFNSAEENVILPKQSRESYESSILAGYSRAARLKFGNRYSTLAADFIAPAYISYTHWVLEKSKKEKITTLYFLSRDSYILQKIAEELPHEKIGLKYLFVSRKSLLLPYMSNASAKKFLAVQDKQTIIGKSVDELLKSLATDKEELTGNYGTNFGYNKIHNKRDEQDFLEKIFGKTSSYLAELNRRAATKRRVLVKYFGQEGLLSDKKRAMVDVGWLGTTRLMINCILKEEGYPETLFFYYGTRGDVLGCQYGQYLTYYRPNQMSTEGTTIIENYFSASPYPSTIGYIESNGKIEPQFKMNGIYQENDITRNNISVTMWLCNEITRLLPHKWSLSSMNRGGIEIPLAIHFWQWGKSAVEEMLKLKKDIDIAPLQTASEFDDTAFVRRLTFKELISIVCLGGRATAFDRGSLRITCGKNIFPAIDKIARFSGKIRRKLYLKLRK